MKEVKNIIRENKNLFLIIIILVIVLFVGTIQRAFKGLFQKVGLIKSDAEQDLENIEKENMTDFKNTYPQMTLTKTAIEWGQIADVIHEDLRYSSIDDNKGDAVYQLCRVKNIMDVQELIRQFGERQEHFFGIPAGNPKTLPTFVRSNLNSDQIFTVNNNYKRKNIPYQW